MTWNNERFSSTKEKDQQRKLGDLNAAAGFSGLTADKLYRAIVPFAFNYIDNSPERITRMRTDPINMERM